MHEKARAGRLAFPLAVLLAVFGWLTPALLGSAGGGSPHQLLLLAEEPAAVPESDTDFPQARPIPLSSPTLAASPSEGSWAVHAPHPSAGLPAGLWFDHVAENSGTPVAAESATRSRAPPSV
ncbi:hypothetical protein [Haloechinothrix salitolerans]|uniref:Uncharacterized protein n=1 Tax=Haloechinothrix salitolerans TaxID=926830 RepID=A0ABW2BTW1_9PSEU